MRRNNTEWKEDRKTTRAKLWGVGREREYRWNNTKRREERKRARAKLWGVGRERERGGIIQNGGKKEKEQEQSCGGWVGKGSEAEYYRMEGRQKNSKICLLAGCLMSQQHASVSQGRICSDNLMCCHTEIEDADQTFHLTQSQYTDTGPTSPSADPKNARHLAG